MYIMCVHVYNDTFQNEKKNSEMKLMKTIKKNQKIKQQ